MNRYLIATIVFAFCASPAVATPEFSKGWKEEYTKGDEVDADFKKVARKAGCNVCHIKGHPDKKKARNEYGKAIKEYLTKEEFTKDYVKANPEEAMAKIIEGIKKANDKESTDGRKFGDKLDAGELPATDAGL